MKQEELDEYYEYENILNRMLEKIPSDIDKREGSIIFDALAPAAIEIAQMYITLKNNMDLIFIDTAIAEYLDRIVKQIGMERKKATKAIKQAYFYNENNELIDIPMGSRFTCNEFYFCVIEKIDTGVYKVEAEKDGSKSNNVIGRLVPVDYINNLGSATVLELLIPGEDEETDESLKNRYIETVKAPPFAGNVTDYRTQVKLIQGVGDLKVVPIWNGGGTVKLIILDSNYNAPSDTLVSNVQDIVFPKNNSNSIGIAPIGHNVTVEGAIQKIINVQTNVILQKNYTLEAVLEDIKGAIAEYLLSLRKKWAINDNVIVRVAQIETRILGIEGILDINNTKINNQTGNIQLNDNEIPIFGQVVIQNE